MLIVFALITTQALLGAGVFAWSLRNAMAVVSLRRPPEMQWRPWPRRAIEAGFRFRFRQLSGALTQLLDDRRAAVASGAALQ